MLLFVALVFTFPLVEVIAIVVMDGVSKDTIELPICSCDDLQEGVVGTKLILCPWHARSVGVWTNGGGLSPSPLTAFPGNTITRASVLPMGVGIVDCTGVFGTASRLP